MDVIDMAGLKFEFSNFSGVKFIKFRYKTAKIYANNV
jgi:hypothetical protein